MADGKGLKPMSIERFLALSAHIKEYTGADLERIRQKMLAAEEAIENGVPLVSDSELEEVLEWLSAASEAKRQIEEFDRSMMMSAEELEELKTDLAEMRAKGPS